ncbi:MAG: antibiotic biosynthesis monooxygenase [Gaiellaceae bacterium]
MHVRMARYSFSGDSADLARRAQAGMLPIFQASSGFQAYSLAESEGEVLSFSVWESAEAAEAAHQLAADWIAENMAGELELLERRTGELLLATALGVTA